jgi:hypothetical protein
MLVKTFLMNINTDFCSIKSVISLASNLALKLELLKICCHTSRPDFQNEQTHSKSSGLFAMV